MGECTGHAVRRGSNIVLMAQECTSKIVPVAQKLISIIRNSQLYLWAHGAHARVRFVTSIVQREADIKYKANKQSLLMLHNMSFEFYDYVVLMSLHQ